MDLKVYEDQTDCSLLRQDSIQRWTFVTLQ